MCGIAGFYNRTVLSDQVSRLTDHLKHRGPDDQRYYHRDQVGLIHTRLSIIDLTDGGAQPYRFENLVIVFNGELYNYQEVRGKLKKNNYTFQSNSDTEVLLKAFHCWGEKCIHEFVGMFAFAIYDEKSHRIWLFRDRLGVKPLYYQIQNDTLIFASELSALSVFGTDRSIDPQALYFYFRFGYVPAQRSIFKTIAKLEAGHWLKLDNTGVTAERYWNPSFSVDHKKKEDEWLEELEQTMISAFRYRMVADVPVGVFLSGGMDSSLLAAVLKKHYGEIHSFTIGFNEQAFDESSYAQQVASHLSIRHTSKTLTLGEARTILDNFYSIYDEPFADTSGIPTACVTQLAKEKGMKVVLSADGGDELFGGYSHYVRASKLYKKVFALPNAVRKMWSSGSRAMIPRKLRDKIVAFNAEHRLYAIEELLQSQNASELFEALIANQSVDEIHKLIGHHNISPYLLGTSSDQDPIHQMMIWDLKHFLTDDLMVKVDRATMYHGIECREPMLDHRLVELAMQIPIGLKMKDGQSKYLERKLLDRYFPAHLFERKKQGFSIPVFAWFQQELDGKFETYLSKENLLRMDVLEPDEVLKEYSKYKTYKRLNKEYNIEKMWRILSFALWWEKYQGT